MLSLTDEKNIKQAEVRKIKDYMTGEAFSLENPEFVMQYYQREYEWEHKHVHKLLDTIFNVNLSNDFSNEYINAEIGSLILQPVKENLVSIMDGQQRTTTLSLIALFLEVLFQKTISLNEENFEKTLTLSIDKRKKEIYSKFKQEHIKLNSLNNVLVNNKNGEEVSKLKFINSTQYNEFYCSLIKNRENIFNILCQNKNKKQTYTEILNILYYKNKDIKKDIQSFKHTLEALVCIFHFFHKKLNIVYDYNHKLYISKESLKDFSNVIDSFFNTLITIEVFSSKINPSIIFQNKNNTGKTLKPIDLIKNTFILAEDGTDNGQKVNDFFKQLKTNLGEDNLDRYVMSVFKITNTSIFKNEKIVSIEKLTSFLNNSVLNPTVWSNNETLNFYKQLEQFEIIYKQIKGFTDPFHEASIYLYILDHLDLLDLYTPVLLELYPKNNEQIEKNKFIKLLQDIIKIYFMGVYNGANNNYINNNIMNISVFPDLLQEVKTNNDIIKFISTKLFFNPIDETKIYEKWKEYNFLQVRKGILYLYELSLSQVDFNQLKQAIFKQTIKENIQIEHIIPLVQKKLIQINPKYKELNKSELNQLGNFILLDDTSNEEAKNNTFIKKKQYVYEKQKHQLKQIELICQKQDFFTIDDINSRTKEISENIHKFLYLI